MMPGSKISPGETLSGVAVFEEGDDGSSKTIVEIRSEATFFLDNLTLSYNGGGSAEADVEVYDESGDVATGELSDKSATYTISPGDFKDLDSRTMGEFEDDVVVVVSNNDSDVHITAEGYLTSG